MFNKLEEHGTINHSHEAQRRSSYAKRMLEELGKEMWDTEVVGKAFRSKVLNPVMQRHRCDVPADYASVVKHVVSHGIEPTIRDATVFSISRSILWTQLQSIHTEETSYAFRRHAGISALCWERS
jgi:hypothetical protein